MNTVNKIRDLYVVWDSETTSWKELVDPNTNVVDFITTASDFNVTNEEGGTQECRVVLGARTKDPRSNVMNFNFEYFLKSNLGEYILIKEAVHTVNKKNFVDVSDPLNLAWLDVSEAYEDDLSNEILDENGNSSDPKIYQQKVKANVLAESNFFVKTFGIPEGGQFEFEYPAINNQAIKKLS